MAKATKKTEDKQEETKTKKTVAKKTATKKTTKKVEKVDKEENTEGVSLTFNDARTQPKSLNDGELVNTVTDSKEELGGETTDLPESPDEKNPDDTTTEVKDDINPEEVINEFNEAAKRVDEIITAHTTEEELKATLENEVKHADETVEKLEEKVKELENKVQPKAREHFAKFWMGSSDGWFN